METVGVHAVCSSPCLCSKQLIVVGGALVVILSVSDDRGQAFTDQSLCYVTVEKERKKQKDYFNKNK